MLETEPQARIRNRSKQVKRAFRCQTVQETPREVVILDWTRLDQVIGPWHSLNG